MLLFILVQNNYFFPATWQYTKHYILKAEQHFLDGVVAAELKNRLLPNEMYC